MTKSNIIDLLEEKHQVLFSWLEKSPEENWEKGPEHKWTLGQHVLHLAKSLQLINNALSFPKFILKYKFGKAIRPSRSYEEIARKYEKKLAQNQEKAATFNSKLGTSKMSERSRLITRLHIQNKKLQYKINQWKEEDLDTYVLPHPLLGKMTIREIIMWTAYHTQNHTTTLEQQYA